MKKSEETKFLDLFIRSFILHLKRHSKYLRKRFKQQNTRHMEAAYYIEVRTKIENCNELVLNYCIKLLIFNVLLFFYRFYLIKT